MLWLEPIPNIVLDPKNCQIDLNDITYTIIRCFDLCMLKYISKTWSRDSQLTRRLNNYGFVVCILSFWFLVLCYSVWNRKSWWKVEGHILYVRSSIWESTWGNIYIHWGLSLWEIHLVRDTIYIHPKF